jgi:hydrogenase maturation protease
MTAPLLVFGWGNLSRGDDALGPMFMARLRASLAPGAGVDCLDDHQLQVEHALDLVGRARVLFFDASLDCRAPFEVQALHAARDASVCTHSLSPQALLQVYRQVQGAQPPPCTLLAIRGAQFALGAAPGTAALAHLEAALHWARGWLAGPTSWADPRSHDAAQRQSADASRQFHPLPKSLPCALTPLMSTCSAPRAPTARRR